MLLLRYSAPLLCGGLLVVACGKHRGAGTDVCAHGACEQLPDCVDGLCNEEPLFTGRGSTVARHSPSAGVMADGEYADCQYDPTELPELETLIDDSEVPEFRRGRSRKSNMNAGNAFLQDHELHENLLTVQGRIFECLDLAACFAEEESPQIGGGELDFQFELEPDGRVSAVTVTPSAELDHPVVISCARRSVFEATFPTWHGGRMVVDYSVEISESV